MMKEHLERMIGTRSPSTNKPELLGRTPPDEGVADDQSPLKLDDAGGAVASASRH